MLSQQETMALLCRASKGDAWALEQLTEDNLALVRSVVRRFVGRGAEYEDLYQLGCVGLVKAIQNFNPAFNVRFSTYAVPMIAGEVKRFLRDDGQVKVGRSLKELAARAMAVRDRIAGERGTPPGICEIAAELEVSAEDVALSLDAAKPTVSLNEPVGEEGDERTREDCLADPQRPETVVDRMLVKELIGGLDEREQKIIVLRYFRDQTQTQVAEALGISQVQVSRLESRILKKMREMAGEAEPLT